MLERGFSLPIQSTLAKAQREKFTDRAMPNLDQNYQQYSIPAFRDWLLVHHPSLLHLNADGHVVRVYKSYVECCKEHEEISYKEIEKLNEESLEAIKRFNFELDACYDLIRKLKHQLKLEKAKNGKRKKK
jgi:predicted ATPase